MSHPLADAMFDHDDIQGQAESRRDQQREEYPSNTNQCNDCSTRWGTAPGGTPPTRICPNCGSDNVAENV